MIFRKIIRTGIDAPPPARLYIYIWGCVINTRKRQGRVTKVFRWTLDPSLAVPAPGPAGLGPERAEGPNGTFVTAGRGQVTPRRPQPRPWHWSWHWPWLQPRPGPGCCDHESFPWIWTGAGPGQAVGAEPGRAGARPGQVPRRNFRKAGP